jgi:hypothetical protein
MSAFVSASELDYAAPGEFVPRAFASSTRFLFATFAFSHADDSRNQL